MMQDRVDKNHQHPPTPTTVAVPFVLPRVMPPPPTANATTDSDLATLVQNMIQNIEDMMA